MRILKKSLIAIFIAGAFLFADEVYNVQKGDTLYSISRKFQITVAELRAANNLTENDVLKAGQKLTIPTADIGTAAALSSTSSAKSETSAKTVKTSEYTVQKGDTLYSLAKKNGMTVPELLALNDFDSSYVLKAGQKIKIAVVSGNSNSQASSAKTEPKSESKPAQSTQGQNASLDKTPDTRTYGETKIADDQSSWPVKNPKITYIKGKVSGVQLACKANETVTCVRAGTVMYVGTYRGFGQVLFVQSKTGLIYAYTGLGTVKAKKGDYLVFGDEIGTAGVDPIKATPQITFMVFQNGTALDPAKAPRG